MWKWRNERRLISRYAVAGLINGVVSVSAIYVCMFFGVSALASNVAGYAAGLLISFSLSKVFVFESKRRTGPELKRFLLSFLVSFLLNLVVLTVLTESTRVSAFIAQFAAISVYVLVMFSLSRWVVFKAGVDDQLSESVAK
jgi:putative flippase GtrA